MASRILILATSAFLFLDGWFHLITLPKSLRKYAPDWVLARGLFDTLGLPSIVHRIMGVFLILGATYVFFTTLYSPQAISTNMFMKIWIYGITPVALLIIGSAVLMKILRSNRARIIGNSR